MSDWDLAAYRDLLETECGVYQQLLSLAEAQHEALLARQTEALQEQSDRQMILLTEAYRLEVAGKKALEQICGELGLNMKATLSEVLERLEPHHAAPLKELRDEIVYTVTRLGRINQTNAVLFECAIDVVRFTMQLLTKSSASFAVYHPAHEPRPATVPLLVDQRA
jgi:flagellar biosynthesis/type III secretory pathway chaperone